MRDDVASVESAHRALGVDVDDPRERVERVEEIQRPDNAAGMAAFAARGLDAFNALEEIHSRTAELEERLRDPSLTDDEVDAINAERVELERRFHQALPAARSDLTAFSLLKAVKDAGASIGGRAAIRVRAVPRPQRMGRAPRRSLRQRSTARTSRAGPSSASPSSDDEPPRGRRGLGLIHDLRASAGMLADALLRPSKVWELVEAEARRDLARALLAEPVDELVTLLRRTAA